MTNEITPPRELVEQLEEQWCDMPVIRPSINSYMATQGAQWGYQQAVKELETFLRKSNEMKTVTDLAQQIADQELEACINYFYEYDRQRWGENSKLIKNLRIARRPKLLSLKGQALEALEALPTPAGQVTADRLATIRRALEALDD